MAASRSPLPPLKAASLRALLLAAILGVAFGSGFIWENRPGQDALWDAEANALDASRCLEKALPSSIRGDGQAAFRPVHGSQTASHALGEAVSPVILPLSQETYGSPGASDAWEGFLDPRRLDSIRPRSPPLEAFSA